ncbi:unnamed protein product [Ambrosiozyma monospora]|uniref:Unnamed protein product n=1 Tax=Ambrosiozyma monospora TaxID=43982 RepID=A0ACB5SRE6_AMBMO|nr:unnamed protein product [Ambrosiozyma monospora]
MNTSRNFVTLLFDNKSKFITRMDCMLVFLGDLLKVTRNLSLLEHLECLKIETLSSQIDFLDKGVVQKLFTWSGEYAENKKRRVVFSIHLVFLEKKSFASMFVSKLADLNKNGDFEIEYNGIRAMEPMGPRLLSDSYNGDLILLTLLDFEGPLINCGLKELARTSKDTDNVMALVEDATLEGRNKVGFIA